MANINDLKLAEDALRSLNETLEQRVAERTAEVRQQADQLRALARELSRAEQGERRRLANILHDHIQQLLVAARMQLAWLKRDAESERLLSTAQGVDSILREALEASRSLTVDLSPPVLHETGLVGGLSWLAARMREKNQFTVHIRADNQAEPADEETRVLLFECVRELLFNAVKHAEVQEAEVRLLRTRDRDVCLLVSDGGKGFEPGLLREHRPGQATFGLFSVQERLAYVGGRMDVKTAPGRGTAITLTVPDCAQDAGSAAPAEYVPSAGVEGTGASTGAELCRVLIVDDHRIMREGLMGLLQFESGIDVVGEAADGPQAITLADELEPHVIIMDVNLGEMSGIEATRRILARHPAVKVVGLSMHNDRGVARAMREAGAAAYLTKGGPAEDLIAAVRACARA